MPYRKVFFSSGGFYHLYSRGVDKREIFLHSRDYRRFQQSLLTLNDERPASVIRAASQTPALRKFPERQPLVSIVCYCLMPNHFHLLLCEKREGGIIKFLRKICTAHAMYFNERYERTGVLFDGRYKVKEVQTDEYLLHLTRYIHLNPLNLLLPDWKEKGVANWEKAEQFLKNYRWSSLPDYLQRENCAPILDWPVIEKHISLTKGLSYLNFLRSW
ncbi:MAG TPA: transposase, partial [bacterium]|nr:transposase [bacterium]